MHLRRRSFLSLPGMLAVSSLAAFSFFLTGCGGGSVTQQAGSGPVSAVPGVAMHGMVFGGQQPVSGSTVQLYAAGSSGYGLAATPLLSPAVVSDASGGFNITGLFTCPTGTTQVYIVATGGNPGLTGGTNNTALALMAGLGNCSGLSSATVINIDEVSTVGSIYALAQFMGNGTTTNGGANLGAANTVAAAAGLANAMATVNTLVYIPGGHAPGHNLPAGATVPTSELNTLADILGTCINTNGTTGECASLFTATTAGSFTPANTIDAMLEIALHPGSNVATIYNLLAANPPFQPTLASAPNDWTVGVRYIGGGLTSPYGIAIDGSGNVWTPDEGSSAVSKFSNLGAAISPPLGFTGGGLNLPLFVTVDASGNAWFTNSGSGANSISQFNSAGTANGSSPFTGGGVSNPYGIATDGSGNVWTANLGNYSLSEFNNSGGAISGSAGYTGGGLYFPIAVAFDSAGNAWAADFLDASLSELNSSGVPFVASPFFGGGLDLPISVAIDASNNVWVANESNVVSEFNSSGTALSSGSGFTGGGLDTPTSVAIDGLGNAWVANQGTAPRLGGISEFSPAGAAITPSTGYLAGGSISNPQSLAIDSSGNVWIPNFTSNSLTEVVGLAAPVLTPLSAAIAGGKIGQRP